MLLTNQVELLTEQVDVGIIQSYLEKAPEAVVSFLVRILLCIVLFFIGTRLIRLVRKLLKRSMEKAGAETGVKSFVDSFVKFGLYILLVFFLLSWFGVDTASIVAVVGSAGVAIGLAVQGSLSNLAGGVLILLLSPFKVGDYIHEDTHGNEGTVKEIQVFYTKLATADNKEVILPNGELSNASLTNYSTMSCRRIDIPVSISYDADLKKAKKVLTDLIEADKDILKDKERVVFVDNLGASAVVLNVRFYTTQENYWEAKWRITEQVKTTLDDAGIKIPFSQLDVHITS